MNAQPFDVRWTDALMGAVVGFVFLLLFYVAKLMGAGDVKFAGALGLWVGVQPLLPIWVGASVLAGMHGLLWLFLQRWPLSPRLLLLLSGKSSADSGAKGKRVRPIPYAAYLALVSAVWMIWGRQS